MLRHPDSTLKEGDACITYKGAVAFAKEFAKRLEASCYGILCRSELSGALAILSCIAAGATFLPLSYRYGRKHCENIFQTVHPEYMITDIIGELRPRALCSARKICAPIFPISAGILPSARRIKS